MNIKFKNSQEFNEHCFQLAKNGNGKIKVSQLKHMFANANGFPVSSEYIKYLDSNLNKEAYFSHILHNDSVSVVVDGDENEYCLFDETDKILEALRDYDSDLSWFYHEMAKIASKFILELNYEQSEDYLSFTGILNNNLEFEDLEYLDSEFDSLRDNERINGVINFYKRTIHNIYEGHDGGDENSLNIVHILNSTINIFINDFLSYLICFFVEKFDRIRKEDFENKKFLEELLNQLTVKYFPEFILSRLDVEEF